ncbi:2-C-methyl-D-erythritol 2,4-cyclodiphosphate synthase [Helicobacter ailurogastricus]|uniref:2-C-methyl-D-erythritol 2,4-cyclodiphosphate synthase n=1 Tax=Helicobacter ailurogastricus TaxID=1578720 RepID=A0A0K2XAJ6_9HELI|nr:2-C-methyl-D-erythritol 2,4-cyclodiphosphate synthase [Helicobacter ailurogastricus]CRF40723.1 2-C-methyl-D-erythritol 4-phosphate cytidylyltransferase / 2-C-methyl-D-erythritol 2,4-cyclodiphosphate synthase [Helicobacter ailurogastricus]CRF43115.1 2-C-methyl-D-erythritol 4-phosphate cytidylyltransferase / 2-C-methyl-D-erythritol 2,4-cyclodiphosphate synthase [Helicobacter ailurogastricus]CRF44345.1 2-C-methyl-D-erythritol 4-phosphate cytidylyltransferase / 2-C-methyl-D-erythritol 2,4-cyclodi
MQPRQDLSLVLAAAGLSTRFTPNLAHFPHIKKQFWPLNGVPLVQKVYEDFKHLGLFTQIFIVVSNRFEQIYLRQLLCDESVSVLVGGASRQESVQIALEGVQTPLVVVSDIARYQTEPLVLERLLERMQGGLDCVAPALSATDTMVYYNPTAIPPYQLLERKRALRVQTPQICRTSVLKQAYKAGTFTDESSAILSLGAHAAYIEGSPNLDKLTFASDLPAHSVRTTSHTGLGLDVHGFEGGKVMKLGGVVIHSSDCGDCGFRAHSDGDVLLHALIDALLGAIGGGDIGLYYSDQDPSFKNKDSAEMLQEIYQLVQGVGHCVEGVDITLFADMPKISPYRALIKKNLAELLNMQLTNINLKATTFEGLGFVGRKEGVGVQVLVQTRALYVVHE